MPSCNKQRAVLKRSRFFKPSVFSFSMYGISIVSQCFTPSNTTAIMSETIALKFFSFITTGFNNCSFARLRSVSSLLVLNEGGVCTFHNSPAVSALPFLWFCICFATNKPSSQAFLNDWMKFLSICGNACPIWPAACASYLSVTLLYAYKDLINRLATSWACTIFLTSIFFGCVTLKSYCLNTAIKAAGDAENPPRTEATGVTSNRFAARASAYKNDQLR